MSTHNIFFPPIMDHDMVLNQHFTCSKYKCTLLLVWLVVNHKWQNIHIHTIKHKRMTINICKHEWMILFGKICNKIERWIKEYLFFLYHNLSICFYTTIYPYVFMENWRKWSFSYHQIPTLSYLLVRGSRFFSVLRQNTLSFLKVEQVLVTIFFEYKLKGCLNFDCPRNSINNTLAVFTMFMRPQIIK